MVLDQGLAVILGVILGAILSSFRAVYEWYAKRNRYETAISLELRRVVRMIDTKLAWLGRSLPPKVIESVPDRIVHVDGHPLYLGEDEKFIIPLPFWKTNYKEIVSLLPNRTFLLFAEAFELVEMFETKTADMKLSFLGTVGNPKEMAAACYQDLLTVHRRLKQCKGLALAQRGLKH